MSDDKTAETKIDWSPDERLEALGYPLDRVPAPAALYRPLVIEDGLAYLSGALPLDGPGNLVAIGKVPTVVSLADATKAAALCAANLLRVLRQEIGSLDKVARVVRLAGYVNSELDFSDQHLIMNGASQLMVDVFGDAGAHARSTIGVAQLPLGAAVEVDAVVKLR